MAVWQCLAAVAVRACLAITTARRCLAAVAAWGALAGAGAFAGTNAWANDAPVPNPQYPRDALREIVQDACVAHWRAQHLPDPCVHIELSAPDDAAGFAILKDRKGGAHFLLIPTATVAGIESPVLLAAASPNWFDAAWVARRYLDDAAGRQLERAEIGLAVNSAHARSQDQLHIHIECLQPALREALGSSAAQLDPASWVPIAFPGWRLMALRVDGETLGAANPFQLLANRLPGARQAMGDYSLLVAGVTLSSVPGFVILAGTGPGTERLLDSRCER